MGEDFKHLRRMLEYKFLDGDHIPYIGISPRNDVHVSEKMKWYEMVWGIIRESSNPNVLTHNFGMTTISNDGTISKLQFRFYILGKKRFIWKYYVSGKW